MTIVETNIEMGKMYKDKNSGFKGIAVCLSKWQYGCLRIGLQPQVKEDGKLEETQFFDEESIENIVPIKKETGGPSPFPKRNPDPKRQ